MKRIAIFLAILAATFAVAAFVSPDAASAAGRRCSATVTENCHRWSEATAARQIQRFIEAHQCGNWLWNCDKVTPVIPIENGANSWRWKGNYIFESVAWKGRSCNSSGVVFDNNVYYPNGALLAKYNTVYSAHKGPCG